VPLRLMLARAALFGHTVVLADGSTADLHE
jgi:hypothetical protein